MKVKKLVEGDAWTGRAATRIANWMIAVQVSWAKRMERMVSKLPPPWLKLFSLIFIAGACAYSGWITWSALNKPSPISKPTPIQVVLVRPSGPSPSPLSAIEKQRIESYLHWYNSLHDSDTGRQRTDSLTKQRPGFIDSLRILLERTKK
jgi:hypothetical protein